jgi:hypothetical protein
LFKGIIDLSFPQFVKYLFWGSTHNKGLFENDKPDKKSVDASMENDSNQNMFSED